MCGVVASAVLGVEPNPLLDLKGFMGVGHLFPVALLGDDLVVFVGIAVACLVFVFVRVDAGCLFDEGGGGKAVSLHGVGFDALAE